MGFVNTGTRDNPFVASAGNPPTFAADMSGISDFFAARSYRKFATVVALVASSGSAANEWAKADNAPGAQYWSDGTRWYLGNIPTVASSGARDALFTGTCQPVAGMKVVRSDMGWTEEYAGLYNSSTNLPGRDTAAGWFPVSVNIRRKYSVQAANASAVAAGTAIFSQAIHRRPYAQRVFIRAMTPAASLAASGSTTGGLTLTATAGGTVTSAFLSTLAVSTTGIQYPMQHGFVDIAAGAGTDVTIALAAAIAAGTLTMNGLIVDLDIAVAGEY